MRTMMRHAEGLKILDVVDVAFKKEQESNKAISRPQKNHNIVAIGVVGDVKVARENI
jgi:hypothetical protein